MGRLNGKVALIIGAGSPGNMGQVIARRFLDEGAKVMVAGRKEGPLKEFAEANGCAWTLCDITKKDEVRRMVAATVETYGAVHIGLNATGWGLLKSFLETTEEELRQMTELQYYGPFYFAQELIPAMKKTGSGSIITISSATATIMLDNHSAYMGAKAGTDHIYRCVANEFGEFNIRANSISPGLTESPMTAEALKTPGVAEAFRREYPLGRFGTADDIAAAAVFLATDECFMTGQNLQVNGGLTLRRNPRNDDIMRTVAEFAAKK